MPCDSCKTIDTWQEFILVPDLIVIIDKKRYLAFVIEESEYKKVWEYIEKHKGILEFKIFIIKIKPL